MRLLVSVFFLMSTVCYGESYIGADGPTFQVDNNLKAAPHALGAVVPKDWASKKMRAVKLDPVPIPAKFSWQDKATPIRNQGNCGSCWSFSAQATIADVLALHGKGAVDLSEQFMVSCDKTSYGCQGGWPTNAFELVRREGDVLEKDFPYTASDSRCPASLPHIYKVVNYVTLSEGVADPEQIKQSIYQYGPVSVAVAVAGAFGNYRSGIYNESSSGQINHAVNIVGWDETEKPAHWIMRNSWGESWGEKGYMKIAYGSRKIGYAATYVDIYGPVPHNEPTPTPTPTPGPTPCPECPKCPDGDRCSFWGWLTGKCFSK